ncbi:MAG: DEAD/DEAH box helicase [Candidatus Binataceae bacterium]|jgi:SNF2 family DNA or RNA helicase
MEADRTMKPYPFQQELIDFLGDPEKKGRLIGDDMGLGKTLEGLAIDKKLRQRVKGRRKTLIIAPRQTHEEPWAETIQEFLGAKACVIDRKNRAPFLRAITSNDGEYEYFVCHYEALRLMPQLKQVPLFHLILDETHRIKNRKAQVTRTVKGYSTVYKTSMSGTPADDKPQDLWSTLNFLYPGRYPSYNRFVQEYCLTEPLQIRSRFGGMMTVNKVIGANPNTVPKLLEGMKPFYMRRLKEEVLRDLPDKYYSRILVDLPSPQRKIYDDLREEMLAWIGEHEDQPLQVALVVTQLVRLQQAALATLEFDENGKVRLIEPSAKLDSLVEVIQDESVHPFVVFSQSKSMINLAATRLAKEGLRVAKFHGDVRDADRLDAVRGFKAGKYDVFASTIAAGGEGIDLTRACTEFFFDRSWSPSKNRQAEDRCHRVTQKNAVQVIDLVARDSVDQRVRETNIHKWTQLRTILGDSRRGR